MESNMANYLSQKEIDTIKQRNFFDKGDLGKNPHVKSKLMWGNYLKSAPLVSVIIPTYKRTDSLSYSIKSVIAQKDFDNFQIVIVDNNPDNYNEKAEVYRIIEQINCKKVLYYCNEKNLGPMGNWNRAIELANTEWICMIHDDDIMHPLHLKNMVALIKTCSSDVDAIACRYKIIRNDIEIEQFVKGERKQNTNCKRITVNDMLYSFVAPLLGCLIKKKLIVSLGGFNDHSTLCEDYIFMTMCSYYGKLYITRLALYGYKMCGQNGSCDIGLWDGIIISQFYFRDCLISKLRKGKFANLKNEYCAIKQMDNYNSSNPLIGTFTNMQIDENNVMLQCNIPRYHVVIFKFCLSIKNLVIIFLKRVKYWRKKG
jgi:glycosyltransferase involved in cell wall biosynthesis